MPGKPDVDYWCGSRKGQLVEHLKKDHHVPDKTIRRMTWQEMAEYHDRVHDGEITGDGIVNDPPFNTVKMRDCLGMDEDKIAAHVRAAGVRSY